MPVVSLTAALDDASRQLGLPMAGQDSNFFEQGLVHNDKLQGESVPKACRAIWDELEQRVIRA